MCGIAGYYGKLDIKETNIKETMIKMRNRGPDNQNYFRYKFDDHHVVLIHSRLSIIDLDKRSNQPFHDKEKVMTFNGEIYNYLEIKSNLSREGCKFQTNSDTEIIMKSHMHYGKECFDKFEGMWAYGIFDKTTKELILSRDRFGEKPLYYLKTSSGFYFGSEIKMIESLLGQKLEIDYNHLKRYIVLGHKSLFKYNSHFYKDIEEVNPGEFITISRNLKVASKKYWNPVFIPDDSKPRDYFVKKVRDDLIKSVELRMRSDVPFSFCLSGGVDSGSLISIASKIFNKDIHTFSIVDRDSRYDESEQINSIIKDTGCINHRINLDYKIDYFKDLNDLIHYHDSPIATTAYFVHSLLSSEIQKQGFKISTSGVGADELFTGYFDHFNYYIAELKDNNRNNAMTDWKKHVQHLVRNHRIRDINNFLKDKNYNLHILNKADEFNDVLIEPIKCKFVEVCYTNKSVLRNRMLNELFHEVVRVILREDDLNSMKYSIENRSPFLDRNLFETSMNIPTSYLINNGYNKSILRDAMKGILHDDVRLFREKRGFNASINTLFNLNSKKFKAFIDKDSAIYSILNKDKLIKIIEMNNNTNMYSKFIFNVICSKMFLDMKE